MKKIQLLLFAVVVLLLFFGGCGRQEDGGSARLEDMAMSMSGGVDVNAMGTGEWMESQNLDGAGSLNGIEGQGETGSLNGSVKPDGAQAPGGTENGTAPGMELNSDEATVIYQGTAFMSSCRTIGGDSIYSTGYLGEFDGSHPADGPYFAGRIGLGGDEIQQYEIEIPEDMFAHKSCVDSQGRWHLLLSQRVDGALTGKKTEIWVINREGELEQSIDITDVNAELRTPGWMTVDTQGNCYFAAGESILAIDIGNYSTQRFDFDAYIAGIGIGRSGALYGVFRDGNGGDDFLGIVDTVGGSIEKCAEFPGNARPTFSALQAGVYTELLLANMGDGIWSYDGAELTQERTLEGIVANGQDILAMGFLWDGRACVMNRQNGKYVFHYVPIEV